MKGIRIKPRLALALAMGLTVVGLACGAAAAATTSPTPAPTATPEPTQTPQVNRLPTAELSFNPRRIPRLDDYQTQVFFTAIASDPDGDPLTYQWEFMGGRPDTATGVEATIFFAGVSPPLVSLTVSDGRGGTVTITDVVPLGFGVHYGPF